MLDIRFIREHAEAVQAAMTNRNAEVDVLAVLALDGRRREIIVAVDVLKADRNKISKSIGLMIKEGKDPEVIKAQVREMGDTIATLEESPKACLHLKIPWSKPLSVKNLMTAGGATAIQMSLCIDLGGYAGDGLCKIRMV